MVLVIGLVNNTNMLNEMEYPSAFIIELLALLSFGFLGLVDSIPNTNWKLYAVISACDFKYHIKRASIFLTAFSCLSIVSVVCITASFGIGSLFKNVYCIAALLFFIIGISFTTGNMLVKVFSAVIFAAIILWLNSLNHFLFLLAVIPAIVSLRKAKNEHGDWYLL
jgi:hypothetical protein